MSKENELLLSNDIFDKVCDLIGIGEDDREISSIELNLTVGQPVTYKCERYAVRRDEEK